MRILAIDFGEARIGLAISDPAGKLAVPLTTLHRISDQDVIDQIDKIVEQEEVQRIVLGEPRNLDGTIGESARRVQSFRRKLVERISLPCDLMDESLTSIEAMDRLRSAGIDPKRRPERIDAVAAQVLLEQYLSTREVPSNG